MLAIIDGDVLAHQCVADRWWTMLKAKQETTNYVRLDSEGKKIPIEWTRDERRLILETGWSNFDRMLNELLEKTFAKSYVMAMKSEDNFRKTMYPEYKMNRHSNPAGMNPFVPEIRKLSIMTDLAIESHGMEADDMIRIWAEEARTAGDPFVICSIDKDLDMIAGTHYNMKYHEIYQVSEIEALRNFYAQLLKGDAVDNIPGIPGVGPKKADKMLEGIESEADMQEAVVSQYLAAYGDDWYQYLLSNGKMIHIMRTPTDYFKIRDWPLVQELT